MLYNWTLIILKILNRTENLAKGYHNLQIKKKSTAFLGGLKSLPSLKFDKNKDYLLQFVLMEFGTLACRSALVS